MAVRFDADGEDYTRTTNLPNGSTFTICCWVKISTDRNTFTTVWSLDNGTGDYIYMQTGADGTTLKVEADGTSTGTLSMTAGTWYFVAFTQSGGTGTFYHAAVTAADLTSASNTLSSVTSGNLRIGESPFGSEWLNGCVAAFKCWSGVALTSAELANERWFAAPVRTDSLNCWHPFEIAETVDYSGNGYTLSGGSGASTEDGPPIHWSGDYGAVIPSGAAATNANAECATASGAAGDSTTQIAPTSEAAAATATAEDATVATSVVATAESATATAVAQDATTTVSPISESASATAAAEDAATSVSTSIEQASATAAANDTSAAVSVSAECATATGVANDATVSTGSVTNASAECATGSAATVDASAAISAAAEACEAAAAALDAAVAILTAAENALASAAAEDAAGSVGASPDAAAATATGNDITALVSVGAECATATGTAYDGYSGSTAEGRGTPTTAGVAQSPTTSGAAYGQCTSQSGKGYL